MLAFPDLPASIGYWGDVNRARAPVFFSSIEDGGFLFSNPAADRLFRGESGTLVGRKSLSFPVEPEERAAMREKINPRARRGS